MDGHLVRRWRNEDDRRLVHLILTEKGQAFLEDVINYRVATLRLIIGDKKDIGIKQLNHVLQYILGQFKII